MSQTFFRILNVSRENYEKHFMCQMLPDVQKIKTFTITVLVLVLVLVNV